MTIHRDARIAARAYEIWEQAGRPHGLDRQHWLQASAEIEKTTVVNGETPVAIHGLPTVKIISDDPTAASATMVASTVIA